MSVTDDVYKSAVKGRKDFRTALRECRAENKALKETFDKTTDLVVDYQERMVEIEQSMDELLEAVSQSEIVFRNTGDLDRAKMLTPIIQKAEALKEKESDDDLA